MAKRIRLEDIAARTESKYALVVAAARRGRAIMDGDPPLVDGQAVKPVTIALEEIQQGYLRVDVPPVGIK